MMIIGEDRQVWMGMDDHSPARRDKREPDSETAEGGARNRAADIAVPRPPAEPGKQPPTEADTAPRTPPTSDEDRGHSRRDGAARERRSGDDERQRGWFWHWNGIVTQFAPLIGLKGVGLLNSYTVWTDRREDSPHRGYAFPSQQSEANFYGEDRAELITINKILVALDLIEVRKEMVLKVDEQGRRWRVPHNFYRVKDRPNGLNLTVADVIRVIELAERDAAVYRYIRKVFSSKFEPIDRDNVWHRILPEVASHPSWQKLAEKAARQEARASARTRAGHRSRNKTDKRQKRDLGSGVDQPESDAPAALMTTGQNMRDAFSDTQQQEAGAEETPTSVADSNNGSPTDADRTNSGFEAADEEANNGSSGSQDAMVAATNNDEPGIVEPGNTTYYESSTTTTTTYSEEAGDPEARTGEFGGAPDVRLSHPANLDTDPLIDAAGRRLAVLVTPEDTPGGAHATDNAGDREASGSSSQRGAAPAGGQGPVGDPSPLVVSLFEAANDRRATPLERILLSELEGDAAAPAQAAGSTGAEWIAAALREAVGSGSAFVAPKRIREIINRWAAEGAGPRGPELVHGDVPNRPTPNDPANRQEDDHIEVTRRVVREWSDEMLGVTLDVSSIDAVWSEGAVELRVAIDGASGAALADHHQRLERALAREFGQPVTLRLSFSEAAGGGASSSETQVYAISSGDAARGRQLWMAVLDDLAGRLPASDLTRMRDVTVLGQGEQGEVYLGASNRLASRYLSGRCRDDVRRALGHLLGSPTSVVVLEQDQWRIGESPER